MSSPQYQSGDTKVVASVYTAKLVPKFGVNAPKPESSYIRRNKAYLPHMKAIHGDFMSLCAQHPGAAGVIIDGKIRDLKKITILVFL